MPPILDTRYLTHLDLTSGRHVFVPFAYQQERQPMTLKVALMSQREACSISWAAGMCFFTDLSLSGAGVATVGLTAAADMCDGRIKKDDYLYSMAIAVGPELKQRAWETVGNLYLEAMLADSGASAAIGDMPDAEHWVAGFAWPVTKNLSENGRGRLFEYARLAAATIANRCMAVYAPGITGSGRTDENR